MPVGSDRPRTREQLAWIGAMILVIAAAAATLVWTLREKPSPELRVEIATLPRSRFVRHLTRRTANRVCGNVGKQSAALWIRALNSVTPHPLAGTENGTLPFWSADGVGNEDETVASSPSTEA